MMSDLLSVKFTASNAVRGKRPYTIYEIEVRSSTTMPWLLYKRYRDFDNLHAQLQKLMATNNDGMDLSNIRLNLPPKRLVRSMAPDVISKRQKKLEQYLHKILSNPQLVRNQLILDFLTVPESLRAMLMRRKVETSDHKQNGLGRQDSDSYSASLSEEEREVNLLLKELSLQKNRVRALGKFERWYFEKVMDKKNPPNMRQDLIKKLYTGDETHQGLVHSCRLLHSKVAWRASISLLVRLLDIERNKYAPMFRDVFLTLNQGLYKVKCLPFRVSCDAVMFCWVTSKSPLGTQLKQEMYLHQHIMETSQEDGFKIVQLIKEQLPGLEHEFYVTDDKAWRQFEKWETMQRDSFGVIGGGKSRVGNEWCEDTVDTMNRLAFNWKEMEYGEISESVLASFKELSAEKDSGYEKVDTMKDLNVRYKKENEQWKLKISFAVNHPPRDVYQFLVQQMVHKEWDKKQRGQSWNSKVIEQRKHQQLDDEHFVIHQMFKKFNSPYTFSDFVLLTCLRPDHGAKRYSIVFASVSNYDDLPEKNNTMNVQRATLLPSGFEIRAMKDNKSHVSYRARMTNESVLTVSADLLGETDELFQSMLGIERLITLSHAAQMD